MVELNKTRGPESAWNFWDLTFAELEELGIPDATDPAWDGFLEILRRPWFTRVGRSSAMYLLGEKR
ncbi:hypothetical protein W97_03078 [Coniosporium apollinis CBS 100218]|uniref:Uncharacterized protein n=1 Tax=Coniosporium apollinis (strain CBS 100218) TaxID=1168221 RepID=R7YPJ5_CONA1|nr:uncharacterized protein W97_03078 [Coniosporium apollinis CBS 100218]EON63850.1 hypothetical protein W97_03078 [Coniosporium apollinis CBS 100218]